MRRHLRPFAFSLVVAAILLHWKYAVLAYGLYVIAFCVSLADQYLQYMDRRNGEDHDS